MILGAYYYNRSNMNVPIECMICIFNVDVTHWDNVNVVK